MLDQLERFHPTLALQSAAIGAVLAGLWMVTGAQRRGGRIGLAAAVATAALVYHGFLPVGPAGILAGAGLLVIASDRTRDSPLVGAWTAVSLVGVWAAVPDTEAPLIVAAIVAVPVAGGLVRRSSASDRVAAMVLVVVAARIGSAGRDEFIGGIGCVGLLASVPLPLRRHLTVRPARRRDIALLVTHTGLVLVASRVLTRADRTTAIVGVVAIVMVAAVVSRLAERPDA
jgi:hypothetical protein